MNRVNTIMRTVYGRAIFLAAWILLLAAAGLHVHAQAGQAAYPEQAPVAR